MATPAPTPARRGGVQPLGCAVVIIAAVSIVLVGAWATQRADEQRKAADPAIGQIWTVKAVHQVQGTTLACEVDVWTRTVARQAWLDALRDPQSVRDGLPDRLKAQALRDGQLLIPNAGTRLKVTDHATPTSRVYEVEVVDGMYRGRVGDLQVFDDGCVGP